MKRHWESNGPSLTRRFLGLVGTNEVSLASAAPARAGEEWQVLVDVLSGKPLYTSLVCSSGTTDVHALLVPGELLGRSIALQAFVFDGAGSALTNALDVVVGY